MNRKTLNGIGLISLLILLAGIPGLYERVAYGHQNALSAAGAEGGPWGLWVVAYIFFSGITAGVFPVAALPHLFGLRRFRPLVPLALVTALVTLGAAMIFITADLGNADRAFHWALNPNPRSVMAWVIGLYPVYGTVSAIMLWATLRPRWAEQAKKTGKRLPRLLAMGHDLSEKKTRRNDRLLTVIAGLGLIISITLAGAVGALFSALAGRAFWHSAVFPVTFVVSALVSGAALVLGIASLVARGGKSYKQTLLTLARFIGFLLVVELIILPAEALITLNGAIPSHTAVLRTIATGPYPWVFWGLQLALGTMVAILLILLPKKPSLAGVSIASLFVLIGVFAFRLNFVIPQLAPMGLPTELGSPYYIPDPAEWNMVAFGVGLMGIVFWTLCRALPVLPKSNPVLFELAARGSRPALPAGPAGEALSR